jgi:hypothetical protein
MAKARAGTNAAGRRAGRKAAAKKKKSKPKDAAGRIVNGPYESDEVVLVARIVLRKSEVNAVVLEWLAHQQSQVLATRSRPEGGPLVDGVPC